MTRKFTLSVALAMILFAAKAQWVELLNGKDLKGWSQVGGKAKYEMIKGELVGTAVADSPNSFLLSDKKYGDFILELEIYVNSELNSGTQIRSNIDKNYRDGVLHGYQVEIDPSTRAWSGGIYDEQRRGWLYPLSRNVAASTALKIGAWNKVHIEAIGNEINTWVNNVHCARLADDMTAEGHIGLQVHSIDGDALLGAQVKWKGIKILLTGLENEVWQRSPEVEELNYLKNKLTSWELSNGYRLLWDGSTSVGWRGAKLDYFPATGWQMKDGELTVLKTDGGEATGPGDIVTTTKFADFELELEFKISEGANSGIKYYVDPTLNKDAGSAIGCEFQLLDDEKHPDAKLGVECNRTIGSLYDLIPANNLSVSGRPKQFKGIDQWNKARIVAKDGKVEHWLNNEKVVEYDRTSQMFKALVAYSKYAKWDNFGQLPEGCILLQDHGDEVSFRSIKIRELN